MMHLVLRHLVRHGRLNAVVLLCLTLCSALLASLSSDAAVIAGRELDRRLRAAGPAERSILITGTPYTFTEKLYEQLREKMGRLLKDRVVIRRATLPTGGQPLPDGRTVAALEVFSFDRLSEKVRVVEGRLPEQASMSRVRGYWPPPIEAVIGADAAEQSGYGVGDRVTASGMYHRLDIVGIVEPSDRYADLWGGDLAAFTIVTVTGEPGEHAALPLVIAPESMQGYLGKPVFPHEVSWRITLQHQLISVDNAGALYSAIVNFQTQSATKGALSSTGFVQILADYLAGWSRVRIVLLLAIVQTLFFALYTLAIIASLIADRSRVEWATLSSRGASVWQVAKVFALESLFLALPAALLFGPGLAYGTMRLWGRDGGEIAPGILPAEAWLLSALAAGLGWLALVLPVFLAARRPTPAGAHRTDRPTVQSFVHKRYLDLYLLALGILLTWQLNRSGSFVMRQLGETQLADPLLLIGPTLLLIALALVFLRMLPWLLRLIARPLQRLRGWVLPLGLLRPAGDPAQPSRMVLLVSLTTGLVLFSRLFRDSLAYGQAGSPASLLVQEVGSLLRVNALALVLFSAMTFLLAHFFAAQGRQREWLVWRAMGLPARQWPALLAVEGILVLFLGLLVGTAFGFGLSYSMVPYLARVLAPLTGAPVERIMVDGPALIKSYVLVLVGYATALLLLPLALRRTRVPLAVWMEDE